jgi:hypothetical protein
MRNVMKKLEMIGLLGLALAVAVPAHATLVLATLSPGAFENCAAAACNTTQNSAGNPIGTEVATTGDDPFVLTTVSGATAFGNYEEVVYRESGGTLDFYIQVQVTSGSDFVQEVSTSNFASFVTDVGTASDVALLGTTGTQDPDYATRSSSGSVIDWTFLTEAITAGVTSETLVISTNATSFTSGTVSLQDGGTVNLAGFAPSSAVPEPATMLLVGGALCGAALIRRRSTKA